MVRAEDVDLMDPGVQEDWYPVYQTLREQAPVWRSPTGEYVLTRYKELQHVLRHPELFPNAVPGQNPLITSPEALAVYQRDGWPRHSPLSTNPPDHRSYRSLVDNWFDKAGAARARPMITALANRLIDEWIDEGQVEFVSRFALPLPIMVITSLLGLPLDDIPQLKVWSEAWVMPFARGLTDVQERYVAEQGVQFQRYIHDHVERKRRHPGDDVLSHLAQARLSAPEGERALTDGEIVNIVDHLFIGGNETTTFALSSGLWLLLSRPEVHRRLVAQPELIPTFVEESLRLESPTQGLWRVVAGDVELAGVAIPAGSVLHLRYAAANRDETMFADAERLDLDRSNAARHLAFSAGEHKCPGADLSRVEQHIAFELLLSRLDDLRFTPGANDFTHLPGYVLRALKSLDLSFRRR
jgi:cytochrome P450